MPNFAPVRDSIRSHSAPDARNAGRSCGRILDAYTYAMADAYELLAQATGFQWDAGNATKSWTKHGVSQAECEQLFFRRPLLIVADDQHSHVETRYVALGQTLGGRLLLVVFTLRGSLVRVISARPMSRREREVYRDAEAEEEADPSL